MNSYHKLKRVGTFFSCSDPLSLYYIGGEDVGVFRNDTLGKKIFCIPKDSTNEVLLYDFNLVPGDTIYGYMQALATIKFGSNFYAVVDSVDSVLVNSSYRKRWNFHTSDNWGFIWSGGEIIEGIGSNYGLLEGFLPMFDNNGQLICHSQNGVTLYGGDPCLLVTNVVDLELDSDVMIYPNPVFRNKSITISASGNKKMEFEVYDVLGNKYDPYFEKNGNEFTVDISTFPNSTYLFLIKDGKRISQKIIILKQTE